MRFDKTVTLPIRPDQVWAGVTDLFLLSECLPGARLESMGPDGVSKGSMSVRVGAMLANFEGAAWISRQEDDDRIVEVIAEGAGSHGRARAVIEGSVIADPQGSCLDLVVSVDISGQLARLGQGMAEPVVDRLIERFGAALAERIAVSPGDEAPMSAGRPSVSDVAQGRGDVLDLGSMSPIPQAARRGAIVVAAVFLGMVLARLLRRPTPTVVAYFPATPVPHGHGHRRRIRE